MFSLAMSSLAIASILGCRSNQFPVAAVSGTVICDGEPVSSGSITFTPIGEPGALETGKAATGALAQDGSFKLSTFDRFDGAIIGKHRVEFNGNDGDSEDKPTEGDEKPTAKPKTRTSQGCILAQELILEVKASGENVFKIELTKSKN